jgi:hypothetical protein
MKPIQSLLIFMVGFLLGLGVLHYEPQPKIELPIGYQKITMKDNLKGFTDEEGVFHITYSHDNNDIRFQWNDTEESIPVDGTMIMLQYTDENTVYIGPID